MRCFECPCVCLFGCGRDVSAELWISVFDLLAERSVDELRLGGGGLLLGLLTPQRAASKSLRLSAFPLGHRVKGKTGFLWTATEMKRSIEMEVHKVSIWLFVIGCNSIQLWFPLWPVESAGKSWSSSNWTRPVHSIFGFPKHGLASQTEQQKKCLCSTVCLLQPHWVGGGFGDFCALLNSDGVIKVLFSG